MENIIGEIGRVEDKDKNIKMAYQYMSFIQKLSNQFPNKIHQTIDEVPLLSNTYDLDKLQVNDPNTFENIEKQEQDFREFNKKQVKLPYLKGMLQAALFNLNENLWTDDVRNYVQDASNHFYLDVHMKVSGSGKTAKILALGTKIHLVYLSATDSISDVDKFTDTSFRNFAENLSLLLAKGWADLLLNVKQEILLFFFARFLHLYILAEHYCKRNKELTPLEFMKHQFNGGLDLIKRIYIQIRSKCIMYSENDLRQLIEETIRKLTETHKIEKIGFVLDEASVAAILFTK